MLFMDLKVDSEICNFQKKNVHWKITRNTDIVSQKACIILHCDGREYIAMTT